VGGHLKTTVALTQPGAVLLGQHVGDLETVASRAAHRRSIDDLARLYPAAIRRVARDIHPDYASTSIADAMGPPVDPVQHHLAHVVACLAENQAAPPALGVAWDGTGYGPDGTVWGGEFLAVSRNSWRRVANLRSFPLPGGEAAAREPRRAALGLLYEAFGERALAMSDLPPIAAFSSAELAVLAGMLARGVSAPRTSSMGRLFDAFAALCGLRQRVSYEAQAACEFEWAAHRAPAGRPYAFPLLEGADGRPLVLDWRPALEDALADLRLGATPETVSAAFHAGLAQAIVAVATRIGIARVALTGGCFQSALLTETAVGALHAAGFEPFWHRQVPPNDGGIALGQAVWAAWTKRRSDPPCA